MALVDRVFVKPSRPTAGNKYFTTKDYGGYLNAVIGSPAAWKGSLLANCTGAAWGCFAQQEQDPDCRIGCAVGNDWYGNAKNWIAYSRAQGYPIYNKPLLGGVIVWDKAGGQGHVGYITKVYSDGSFDTVESGWGASAIWWSNHYGASGYRSGYTLLGYIGSKKYNYIEEPAIKIVDPVARDITKDQVICHTDGLRVRTSPSLNGVKIGHILKDKYYNSFGTTKADGYTWYKLADKQWVAGIKELELLPKIKVIDPVEKDTSKDQVICHDEWLRVRATPNLKGSVLGYMLKDKYYNYFKTSKADGYTWYQLADNQWCAGIPELEVVPKTEYYIVQQGDTLASIAKKNNLTLEQLCDLNPQLINVGDKLKIR